MSKVARGWAVGTVVVVLAGAVAGCDIGASRRAIEASRQNAPAARRAWEESRQALSEFDAGVRDVRGGQMPAGSVPCSDLPEELRVAVDVRRASGLSVERTRGQVHEKYRIVMSECGVSMPAIR